MKILGIETSCDETAAAIVEDGKTILSNVVASSASMHQKYGGIVPEVAARMQTESMIPVLTEAMEGFEKDDIDAIAVTVGPGLIGSLLVGVETAKTLSFAWDKPIIPVNHVLAHVYAVFLEDASVIPNSFRDLKQNGHSSKILKQVQNDKVITFPAIALVVSGGHTELYLMKDEKSLKWLGGTLDDAAGECFDKCARLLGLPYPGGPEIAMAASQYQELSSSSEPRANREVYLKEIKESPRLRSDKIALPRPMIHDGSLNFSFSGLKTAVLREVNKSKNSQELNDQTISMFSHEIQESITDVLVTKTLNAAYEHHANSIIVSGGVAANQRLTHKYKLEISALQFRNKTIINLLVPPPSRCVDSASFIAAYAYRHRTAIDWKQISAIPDLSVEI